MAATPLAINRSGVLASCFTQPPCGPAPGRAGDYPGQQYGDGSGQCVECNTDGDNQNDCLALGYRNLSPEFQALAAQLPQLASSVPAINMSATTCQNNVCVRPATCTSSNQCPDDAPICSSGTCGKCVFANDQGLPCLERAARMGTTKFQCELTSRALVLGCAWRVGR